MADARDASASEADGPSPRAYYIWDSQALVIGNGNTQYNLLAEDSVTQAVTQLAAEVAAQWRAEAQVRRVNDKNALVVSWTDADLVESPAATEGPHPDDAPGRQTGSGDLLPVLRGIPSGRLVVLGGPGTGKTVLLVRLVLDLTLDKGGQRLQGPRSPVPILLPLASWNPLEQDFASWFVDRICLDHPWLAAPLHPTHGTVSAGRLLFEDGWLLPLLDGLDEIPVALRSHAVVAMNEALGKRDDLVLSCRTDAYWQAIHPPDAVSVPLRRAAVIRLCEPDSAAVRRYVVDEAGGTPEAAARWHDVVTELGTDTPVGQTLRTPLMISLASEVYNPRPSTGHRAQVADKLPDPAELCDRNSFPRAEDIEKHLFESFLRVAYRRRLDRREDPWPSARATRHLTFLARHLEHNLGERTEIAWWELPVAATGWGPAILLSALCGILGAAFTSVAGSWLVSIVASVVLALLAPSVWFVRGGDEEHPAPAKGVRWSVKAVTIWILATAAFVAVCGLIWGYDAAVNAYLADFGWTYVILVAIGVQPADIATQVTPAATLSTDRRFAWTMSLVGGIGTTVAAVAIMADVNAPGHTVTEAILYGLRYGFAVGGAVTVVLGLWLCTGAWGQFAIGHIWLALRRQLPWRLMGFLKDAHLTRGVLRQTGATYQFRHSRLQQHLAGDEPPPRHHVRRGMIIVSPEEAIARTARFHSDD